MALSDSATAPLGDAQRGFEKARDRVWMDRIGAGLAYRRQLRKIDEKVEAAREVRDRRVVEAVQAGGSYREVARATGISHSRVQQIVNATLAR